MAKHTPMSPQDFAVVLDRMKAARAAEKNRMTQWEEDERKRQASDEFLARALRNRLKENRLMFDNAGREMIDEITKSDQANLTRTAPMAFAWEI